MPPALHRHLKRGLDLGCRCQDEPDVALDGTAPTEYGHQQDREAKRRRIEAIAVDYLRGRPPLLLSAGLRGPFNNGWKNPWATTRPRRASSETSSATLAATSPVGARNAPRAKTSAQARRKNRHYRVGRPLASPEASRAPSLALSFHDYDSSDAEVEVDIPPPTAPSPTQHDASAATDFFTPPTDPFWLRRPESDRRRPRPSSSTPTQQGSPTRPRGWRAATVVGGNPRAGMAKTSQPKPRPSSPAKTPIHQHWRSSASASMIISSPAYNKGAALKAATHQDQHQDTAHTHSDRESSGRAPAQDHIAPRHNLVASPAPASSTGFRYRKVSNHKKKHGGGQRAKHGDGQKVTRGDGESVQHGDDQRIVQHGDDQRTVQHGDDQRIQHGDDQRIKHGDDQRTELGDDLNTKLGDDQKSKARAVDFNSSPARTKTPWTSTKHNDQDEPAAGWRVPSALAASEEHGAKPDRDPIRTDTADEPDPPLSNDTILDDQPPQHGSSPSSRPSAMSTQAAMLLAQLEFQESTYRTLSPTYAQEWSPLPRNSPRRILHQPSPAMTPLSVFSTRLDAAFSHGSMLRGAPISTQDLFGAASPFAFSTIKKKPTAPFQSGLRSGLAVHCAHSSQVEPAAAKSPRPSGERIPLKAKGNTTPSLWGFVHDNMSQASQESLVVDRTKKCVNDVELPQLDLPTSLDDLEANGGCTFTDGFLRNLETSCIETT